MASETASSHQLTAPQLLKVAMTAESAGDLDRALGYFRALGEVQPANPRWAFEAIRILRKTRRSKEAKSELAAAMKKWPRAASRPEIVAIIPELAPDETSIRSALRDDCPPDEALKRAPIEDDGSDDFIVARGGRKTAVLVFTGLADRIGMPLPIFDRYLAELDLSAIYLRDKKRIGFFHGVATLGEDYDQPVGKCRHPTC